MIEIEQHWDIHYRHAAGETGSHFFRAPREKRLLGRRCPQCRRVLLPPRGFCDRCFVTTDEWVEVAPDGGAGAVHRGRAEVHRHARPALRVAYARLRTADTVPPPLYHHIFAMLMRVPDFRLEGDTLVAAQNIRALARMCDLMRVADDGAHHA